MKVRLGRVDGNLESQRGLWLYCALSNKFGIETSFSENGVEALNSCI